MRTQKHYKIFLETKKFVYKYSFIGFWYVLILFICRYFNFSNVIVSNKQQHHIKHSDVMKDEGLRLERK